MSNSADQNMSDARAARLAAAEHRRQLEASRHGHDLEMERLDTTYRHRRDWAVLVAVFALGGIICLACLFTIFLPGIHEDLRKTALTGLFSLVTAGLAFLAGRGLPKD